MAQQCQAIHPTEKWPYVLRCRQAATRFKVSVRPLGDELDLCETDFDDYLDSLTTAEAVAMHERHKGDTTLMR